MEHLDVLIQLVLVGGLVIGITVAAVVALWKGERPGKTFKTWLVRLVDAIAGL